MGMTFVPVMWALWGAAFFFMAAVTIYASRLTRNEEDQLFLAESSNSMRTEQDAIASRVQKVQPVKRTALVFAIAMTLVVLGYYILDIIRRLA
jgi:hypothetical protein